MDSFKGNGGDVLGEGDFFGNKEGIINNLCRLFIFQDQGGEGNGLTEVDIFKASQEELIKTVLEKDAVLEGYVAENDALRKNVDNLVKAKIIADRKNSELERREVERDIAWRESCEELKRQCKQSEERIMELESSLKSREFHIKEFEREMLVVRGFMSEVGKAMFKFSSQEKRLEMLPRLEKILNILARFVERDGEVRTKKKKE